MFQLHRPPMDKIHVQKTCDVVCSVDFEPLHHKVLASEALAFAFNIIH